MTFEIPEDLKNRLLAAGVQDEASLEAALAADDDLRAAYERWVIGYALQQFAETADPEALRALTARMPVLLEAPMIRAIERAIGKALESGDESNATALSQRLRALLEIQKEQAALRASQPLAQALIDFVQASDNELATAVFRKNQDLLASQEAEALLFSQFEGRDSAAKVHLEQRRELFRRLLDEDRARGAQPEDQ